MSIFQIIILIILFVINIKWLIKLLKNKITVWFWLIIFLFSLLIALINLFPNIISYLADWVGVGRGVDLMIYLAILFIFYSLFKISVKQNQLDKKITKIVRRNAINNVKKNHE